MPKVRFELNHAGVRELLRSKGMEDMVKEKADTIQQKAGEGYASDTYVGRNRVNASVWPETIHAKNSNLKHNTLLKAMGGAKK